MKRTTLYNKDGSVRQVLDPICHPATTITRRHIAHLDYVVGFGQTARAVCETCGCRVISHANYWVTSTYIIAEEIDVLELIR